MQNSFPDKNLTRVVIIGGGFGGLELAKALNKKNFQVVMLDKNNYHTFQPLLYQVSSAGLEAESIAYPIRKIFKKQKNFHFRWCEVKKIVPEDNKLETNVGYIRYDFLVIATGSTTNFFGIEGLSEKAMTMKTVSEALELRNLILQNLEKALIADDPKEKESLMTFVIVGGGPTGVELAGALSELKRHVLPEDYPELDLRNMRVILIESGGELLQHLQPENQQRALKYLTEMGVEIWLNVKVVKYDGKTVFTASGKELTTSNLIWTAGVKGNIIEGLSPEVIHRGRYLCDEFNMLKGYKNIFAIGDVALQEHEPKYPNGHPQIAPVAIQQGKLLAKNLVSLMDQHPLLPFEYRDKGNMATIGRNKAVVEIGKMRLGGFLGWALWMLLHLILLIGFRNKIIVLINWIWNYINYDRNIRLIIRPYERQSTANRA
jgi:NADH dehydrogenase